MIMDVNSSDNYYTYVLTSTFNCVFITYSTQEYGDEVISSLLYIIHLVMQ